MTASFRLFGGQVADLGRERKALAPVRIFFLFLFKARLCSCGCRTLNLRLAGPSPLRPQLWKLAEVGSQGLLPPDQVRFARPNHIGLKGPPMAQLRAVKPIKHSMIEAQLALAGHDHG